MRQAKLAQNWQNVGIPKISRAFLEGSRIVNEGVDTSVVQNRSLILCSLLFD